MDAPTIERLVRGVATDFAWPVDFVSAVASDRWWEIVVEDTARGRALTFWIYDGKPAAMRSAIHDRLEALLESS